MRTWEIFKNLQITSAALSKNLINNRIIEKWTGSIIESMKTRKRGMSLSKTSTKTLSLCYIKATIKSKIIKAKIVIKTIEISQINFQNNVVMTKIKISTKNQSKTNSVLYQTNFQITLEI
jgi:hypothetical protein